MLPRSTSSFEERVGLVLVEGGFLTRQQLTQAQEASRVLRTRLLDTLVSLGMLTWEKLVTVFSFQLRIPVVGLRHVQVDPEAVRLVPEEYARQNTVLPLEFDIDDSLRIAANMPNNFQVAAELFSMTGHQIKFVLALGGSLEELIDRTYAAERVQRLAPATQTLSTGIRTVIRLADQLSQDARQLLSVQAVDLVIRQAIKTQASEIYMVPSSPSVRVLFRGLDDGLQNMIVLPLSLHKSMVSCMKVWAGLDIAETKRFQDGTFTRTFGGHQVNFGISCVGTTWGELMVIRILDRA